MRVCVAVFVAAYARHTEFHPGTKVAPPSECGTGVPGRVQCNPLPGVRPAPDERLLLPPVRDVVLLAGLPGGPLRPAPTRRAYDGRGSRANNSRSVFGSTGFTR